jgi:hypothetical protein
MRIAVVGAGVVASLGLASLVATLLPTVGFAQRVAMSSTTGTGGLIALATPAGEQRQQVTVIDPEKRVLSVYHIDLATGEVTLKSVRNIHWDLQMTEFNGTSPLPREVRSLIEQR